MLDHETQVRRLFARLAQRTDGAVLGAVVGAARSEGPAAYFVANALRSHETLDERAAVTVLADLPFEARVRFAAERASGPEAVAGLFDVEDFDEELGYTLDDLDDLDDLSTIPEWLWVTFAELGGKDTVSRILRVCPSLAGRLLGRVAEFGRPDQLELLGRCPALTAAALTTGDGPLYDAALDVAMAGWAGEVTTEISVTQAQIDEWLRRRPFELVAAGEGRVVDAAAWGRCTARASRRATASSTVATPCLHHRRLSGQEQLQVREPSDTYTR